MFKIGPVNVNTFVKASFLLCCLEFTLFLKAQSTPSPPSTLRPNGEVTVSKSIALK